MNEEHLTTNEVAAKLKVKADTIRRGLCVDGSYLGLRPLKLKNRRLLWSAEGIRKILAGGQS